MAVRLRDHADTGQVGRLPVEAGQHLGEGAHGRGHLDGARVVGELDRVAAQGGQAGRLEPDDRHPGGDVRRERGDGPLDDRPGPVELAGGDPGQPAAGVVRDHRARSARRQSSTRIAACARSAGGSGR